MSLKIKKLIYSGLIVGAASVVCIVPFTTNASSTVSTVEETSEKADTSPSSPDFSPIGGMPGATGYGYINVDVTSVTTTSVTYSVKGIPQDVTSISFTETFGFIHLLHDDGSSHGSSIGNEYPFTTPRTMDVWSDPYKVTYITDTTTYTPHYLEPYGVNGNTDKYIVANRFSSPTGNNTTDLFEMTIGGMASASIVANPISNAQASITITYEYILPTATWLGFAPAGTDKNVLSDTWLDNTSHGLAVFDTYTGAVKYIDTGLVFDSTSPTGPQQLEITNEFFNSGHIYNMIIDKDGDGDYQVDATTAGIGEIASGKTMVQDFVSYGVSFADPVGEVIPHLDSIDGVDEITSTTAYIDFTWSGATNNQIFYQVWKYDQVSQTTDWSAPITAPSATMPVTPALVTQTAQITGLEQNTTYIIYFGYNGQELPTSDSAYDEDSLIFTTDGKIKDVQLNTALNGGNGSTQDGAAFKITPSPDAAYDPTTLYYTITPAASTYAIENAVINSSKPFTAGATTFEIYDPAALIENTDYKLWLSEDKAFTDVNTWNQYGSLAKPIPFTTDSSVSEITLKTDIISSGYSYQDYQIKYEDNTAGSTVDAVVDNIYLWLAPLDTSGVVDPNTANWLDLGPISPSSSQTVDNFIIDLSTKDKPVTLRANTTYQMMFSLTGDISTATNTYYNSTTPLPIIITEDTIYDTGSIALSDNDDPLVPARVVTYNWNSSESGTIYYSWMTDTGNTGLDGEDLTFDPATANWVKAGDVAGSTTSETTTGDLVLDQLPSSENLIVAFSIYGSESTSSEVVYLEIAQPGYVLSINSATSDVDMTKADFKLVTQDYTAPSTPWSWRVYESSDVNKVAVDNGTFTPVKDIDGTGAVQISTSGLIPGTDYVIEVISNSDFANPKNLITHSFTTEQGIHNVSISQDVPFENNGYSYVTINFDYDSDELLNIYYRVKSAGTETTLGTQTIAAGSEWTLTGTPSGDGDDYTFQTAKIETGIWEEETFELYISSNKTLIDNFDPASQIVSFTSETALVVDYSAQPDSDSDGIFDETGDSTANVYWTWNSQEIAPTIYWRNIDDPNYSGGSSSWNAVSTNGASSGVIQITGLNEGANNRIEFSIDPSAVDGTPQDARTIKVKNDPAGPAYLTINTSGYFSSLGMNNHYDPNETDSIGLTTASFKWTTNQYAVDSRDYYFWVEETSNPDVSIYQATGNTGAVNGTTTGEVIVPAGTLKPGTNYTAFISTEAYQSTINVQSFSFVTDIAVSQASIDTTTTATNVGYSYFVIDYKYASQESSNLYLKDSTYNIGTGADPSYTSTTTPVNGATEKNALGNYEDASTRTLLVASPWTSSEYGATDMLANIAPNASFNLLISSESAFGINSTTSINQFSTDKGIDSAVATPNKTGNNIASVDVTWTSNESGKIYSSIDNRSTWTNEDEVTISNSDTDTSTSYTVIIEGLIESTTTTPLDQSLILSMYDYSQAYSGTVLAYNADLTLTVQTIQGITAIGVGAIAANDIFLQVYWDPTMLSTTEFTISDGSGIVFTSEIDMNQTTLSTNGWTSFWLSDVVDTTSLILTEGSTYTIQFSSGISTSWVHILT